MNSSSCKVLRFACNDYSFHSLRLLFSFLRLTSMKHRMAIISGSVKSRRDLRVGITLAAKFTQQVFRFTFQVCYATPLRTAIGAV